MKAPRYTAGARVRVIDPGRDGHVRTPYYVRGRTGVVEVCTGAFLNPEDLAYGRTAGPAVDCYRVVFEQTELWPDYRGSGSDRLHIEIYEHWLEPAPAA